MDYLGIASDLKKALSFYSDSGGKGDPAIAQEKAVAQDKLRELAVVLYEKVKSNARVDWTVKESAKAKLKVIFKRTLLQFGYPPDMQMLATETVLKQAELIATEMTGMD